MNNENKDSKHKEAGKHSLKHDSIFLGKKSEDIDDEFHIDFQVPKQKKSDFETISLYGDDGEDYERLKELKEDMYHIIIEKTKINIKTSRRKPGKDDFNQYMNIICSHLDMRKYQHYEVFIELAYYFSDNITNMFKLLNKDWGGKVAIELSKRAKINLDDIEFF